MNPFDSIPSDVKQKILEAKDKGMTQFGIMEKYGFDWDVIIHCLANSPTKNIEIDMYHQGFRYTFKWKKHKHRQTANDQFPQSYKIYKYMNSIVKERFPKRYFNDGTVQRISQFRLNRLKRGVVAGIGKKMIREGEIIETLSIHPLTKISKHLFANHIQARKPKPSHHDIQTRVLEQDSHAIAMEVPIWGEPPITPKIVTGHIDLIRIIDDVLYIVDYKPEHNFMPSIPQVAFYGLLLRKNLNLKKIRCISFSNKKAWEFNPDILYEIDDILAEHNIHFFPWQKYIEKKKKRSN